MGDHGTLGVLIGASAGGTASMTPERARGEARGEFGIDEVDGCVDSVGVVVKGSVAIFKVDLMAFSARISCLPSDELEAGRASRFRFERDRRRYLAARRALRELLASTTGVKQGDLRIGETPDGKPVLSNCEGTWHFNVSHSGELALIAISAALPVGIDIEYMRGSSDYEQLAAQCLTPAEAGEWALFGDRSDRQDRFLGLWTRKEAVLKALGVGLALSPAEFTTGFGPEPTSVSLLGRSATVWSIDIGVPAARAAVALELRPPTGS